MVIKAVSRGRKTPGGPYDDHGARREGDARDDQIVAMASEPRSGNRHFVMRVGGCSHGDRRRSQRPVGSDEVPRGSETDEAMCSGEDTEQP